MADRWEVIRAALLTLVLACALGAAAGGARAAEVGVVADLTWGATPFEQDRTTAEIRASGARWVRLSIQWKNIEQALPGVYDVWWLAHVDRAVALANAAGLNVLMLVYDAPAWASGSAARTTPRDPADYARFLGFVADRYRGRIQAYEIWNEQNLARFWTSPSASAYTQLLRAAYPAVKAADPAATVVFGGLSTSDYGYVEAAYAAGAKGYFDAMAVHPYTYCGTGSPDEVRRGGDGRITRDSFLGYREVRASMLARGDDRPIWITEFGWNTSTASCDPAAGRWQGGVSEAAQATHLARAYQLFAADAYVGPAFAYNFRNNYWQGDADEPEARYGLVRTDFSPKPALEALRAAAAATAGGPTPPAPVAAPFVRLTSPADGSSARGSITMAADAGATAVRVVFSVDGRVIHQDASAPYSYRWTGFKKLVPGPHTVQARAFDAAGRSSADAVTVTRLR